MGDYNPSFGVESEFMVCVQVEGFDTDIPEMFRTAPGMPIRVPLYEADSEARVMAQEIIQRKIDSVTSEFKGDRLVKTYSSDYDNAALDLMVYEDWRVDTDYTLEMARELLAQEHMASYTWVAIELISPALWAGSRSFEEVRRVFKAVKESYWICTPPSAGLHIHYANDPILTQLHPGHRRNNPFCPSNRYYSRLAHAPEDHAVADNTSRRIRSQQVEADPEIPSPGPESPPPATQRRGGAQRAPKFRSVFERGTLASYEFNAQRFALQANAAAGDITFPDADDDDTTSVLPISIPWGASHILRATNAPTVAALMHVDALLHDRAAYNFNRYGTGLYGAAIPGNKRTVEFRQAGATVDPEEVVAHARVVVRLCRWAGRAPLAELWKVVLDCHAGGGAHPGSYDVFDLLVDVGLVDEAGVLQGAMARERGGAGAGGAAREGEPAEPRRGRVARIMPWLAKRRGGG